MPGFANPQNLNRYSYVRNNPLRYVDPSGHMVACNPMEDDCHDPDPAPSPAPSGENSNNPNDPTDEEDDPNPNGYPHPCSSIICNPTGDQGSSTTSPYTGAQPLSTWFSTPGYSIPQFVVGGILFVGGLGLTAFGTALGIIALGEVILGAPTGPGEFLVAPHALAMTAVGGFFFFSGLGTSYIGYLGMKDGLTS